MPHFSHSPGAISKDRLGVKIYPGCTMGHLRQTGEVVSANMRKQGRGLQFVVFFGLSSTQARMPVLCGRCIDRLPYGRGSEGKQARMPVLRGRCVGFVLTVFALDVGLDIAF